MTPIEIIDKWIDIAHKADKKEPFNKFFNIRSLLNPSTVLSKQMLDKIRADSIVYLTTVCRPSSDREILLSAIKGKS